MFEVEKTFNVTPDRMRGNKYSNNSILKTILIS